MNLILRYEGSNKNLVGVINETCLLFTNALSIVNIIKFVMAQIMSV